jgi:hypothetical protein
MHMRVLPTLTLLAVLASCARHPPERAATGVCVSPAPVGTLRTDSAGSSPGVLRGRLAWDGGRPTTPVRVRVSRSDWTRTVGVQADTFRIAGLAPGDYELRTLMGGQYPRVDSVRVTSQGLSVLVPFAWTLQLDGCGGNTVTVPSRR